MIPSTTTNPGTSGMAQALSRGGVRGISSRRVRVLRDCPERRDANKAIKALNERNLERANRDPFFVDLAKRTGRTIGLHVWPLLGPSTPPSSSRAAPCMCSAMHGVAVWAGRAGGKTDAAISETGNVIGVDLTTYDVAETLGDL